MMSDHGMVTDAVASEWETRVADAVASVLEAQVADAQRREIDVTIIRPGISANGLLYREDVLRASVPLWEGAAAFLDHPSALDMTRAGQRSLRDLVGVYSGVHYDDGIRARLHFYPNAQPAYDLAAVSIADRAAGRAVANVGISADMRVVRRSVELPHRQAQAITAVEAPPRWHVERIVGVVSADLVFQPSAGGSFDRIVEGDGRLREPPIRDPPDGEPFPVIGDQSATVGDQYMTSGQQRANIGGATMAATTTNAQSGSAVAGDIASPDADTSVSAGITTVRESAIGGGTALAEETASLGWRERIEASLADVRQRVDGELHRVEETRRAACADLLRVRLEACTLPEAARTVLRNEMAGRVFEAEELDRRIESLRTMLGAIFGGTVVRGMGTQRIDAHVGMDPVARVQAAVDRLFGVPVADAMSDVPRLSGIREAYLVITGDRGFTGRYDWDNSVVREANEVTTSILTNTVANSMTKRIERDYALQPKWWEPIVLKTGIADFKQQQRIHLNDFAALSTVSENAAYTNLAWGDTRETYTASKRGNLVVVTLEMIVNDDTGAVVRIPQKLASAAVVTINEFVAGLFIANSGAGSTMSDTFAVFDATNHQGNATTAALSASALQTALIAMLKFTNSASKRIGVVGRYLLTPPDLHFAARVILDSSLTPGTTNNDINPVRGALIPISIPNWTDTNNWYVLADPAQVEGIELGFLNGREEPELIVQDSPTAGSVFTNDALSWKVRHIFGGAWLDYRSAYGSIVP